MGAKMFCDAGIYMYMGSANGRRRYIVTGEHIPRMTPLINPIDKHIAFISS